MSRDQRIKVYGITSFIGALVLLLAACCAAARSRTATADNEYLGSLDNELVPDTQELDQVVFHALRDLAKVKFATPPESGGNVAAGRLYDPLRDKSAILAV